MEVGGGVLGQNVLGGFVLGTIQVLGSGESHEGTVSASIAVETISAAIGVTTISADLSVSTISADVTINE